jgi:hypothetical protein
MPSPIVLFAFARPDHILRTLEALAANVLADQSDLIVYSDAARNESEAVKVRAVRDLVNAASGFRSLTVIERETNYGLARNIVEGVTEVCKHYGRVIVLEDDIVTSPHFLSFMNAALDRYADDPCVWHVSGWNYPIDPEGLGDAFFWRAMNCWGWATWADRWEFFQKDPQCLIESWDEEKIKRFNLDGAHDFWGQITANQAGNLDTWAIFWYATIFENGGLCLNPARSFVSNIGHDGSGENCGGSDLFTVNQFGQKFNDLPECNEELTLAVQRIKAFYDDMQPSFSQRVIRYVINLITGINGFRQ